MRKSFLLLSCFSIAVTAAAQKKDGRLRIDSLLALLPASPPDTNRTKLYYNIAQEYVMVNPPQALLYADTGMNLAEKQKWDRGKLLFYTVRGNVLSDQGKGAQALEEYQQALRIAEKSDNRHSITILLNDIGGVYFRQSSFARAMEYYERSLKMAEVSADPNQLGTAYTNFSTVYYAQQNYDKAIEYSKKALASFESIQAGDKIARSLNYIGNSYLQKGDLENGEQYYQKALAIYEKNGNRTGMAILYSQIAILYDPDYRKIISYQEKSQAIWDSINPTHYNSIINLGNMGESYLNILRADSTGKLGQTERQTLLTQAAHYLSRAVEYSRETNDQDNLAYFSETLAGQQEMAGNYRSALANYKLSYAIRDSLFSQETKNRIAALESQREIEQRDREIALNRKALDNERNARVAMIAGLVLLVVIGFLLYRQGRIRKRTNTTLLQLNTELDEANKVKARFFAILSHDLRQPIANLVSFLELQQEAPGILTAEEAAAHQQSIGRSARSLLETMEAMLLWSKGQMEYFKPQIRQIPVSQLFAYIRQTFADQYNVHFVFSDPGNLFVHADENYLQTIMHNLTANAIKAMKHKPDGVITWAAFAEGDKTVLSITDNGPGLPEEQAKVLHDSGVAPNARTGFGLHLVRDLSRAIQFNIKTDSKPGHGTTILLVS